MASDESRYVDKSGAIVIVIKQGAEPVQTEAAVSAPPDSKLQEVEHAAGLAEAAAASGDGCSSRLHYAAWLMLGVVGQLAWGLNSVFARYLMVHDKGKVPKPGPMQLMVALSLLSIPTILLTSTFPPILLRAWRRRRAAAAEQAAREPSTAAAPDARAAPSSSSSAAAAPARSAPSRMSHAPTMEEDTLAALCEVSAVQLQGSPPLIAEAGEEEGKPAAEDNAAAAAATAAAQPLSVWRRVGAGALVGLLISAMTIMLYWSASIIPAYLNVMAIMSTPLMVTVIEACIRRRAPPPALYPAIALTLAASGLVIAGSWAGNGGNVALTQLGGAKVAGGLALAFAGAVVMSFYMVSVQMTASLVTTDQVMWANRLTLLIVVLPFALTMEDRTWAWVPAMTPALWGILVAWASIIFTASTLLIQVAVRRLGSAAPVAMCISLRLVSALAGQQALLPDEQPASPVTIAGVACVIVVVTGYLGLQAFAPASWGLGGGAGAAAQRRAADERQEAVAAAGAAENE